MCIQWLQSVFISCSCIVPLQSVHALRLKCFFPFANSLLLEAVLIDTLLLIAELFVLTCFILHGAGF